MDRVKTERYDTTANGNLMGRSETKYDDRGHVDQTIQHGVNPATGAVGNALTDNTWYDASGNVIKSLPSGARLFTKTIHDGLGRRTKQSRGYDLDETAYSEASTLSDDTLLDQTEFGYDAARRQTKLEQNWIAGSSSSSSSSSGPFESDDTNVTVLTAYNADGNVSGITAVNSVTGNQTTTYVYGTTLSDSGIASSLLKRAEIYPDTHPTYYYTCSCTRICSSHQCLPTHRFCGGTQKRSGGTAAVRWAWPARCRPRPASTVAVHARTRPKFRRPKRPDRRGKAFMLLTQESGSQNSRAVLGKNRRHQIPKRELRPQAARS